MICPKTCHLGERLEHSLNFSIFIENFSVFFFNSIDVLLFVLIIILTFRPNLNKQFHLKTHDKYTKTKIRYVNSHPDPNHLQTTRHRRCATSTRARINKIKKKKETRHWQHRAEATVRSAEQMRTSRVNNLFGRIGHMFWSAALCNGPGPPQVPAVSALRLHYFIVVVVRRRARAFS